MVHLAWFSPRPSLHQQPVTVVSGDDEACEVQLDLGIPETTTLLLKPTVMLSPP